MSKTQSNKVAPPLDADKEGLNDFSAIVQRNFEDVFQDLHTHDVRTSAPTSTEGSIGDILPVKISSTYYLYVKFDSSTWKRVALS
jgi:hypothetical protein